MIDGPVEPSASARRGPARYFWWLIACQPRRIAAGAFYGNTWMIILTFAPYAMSRAIDDGLVAGSVGALLLWTAALLGAGTLDAWIGILRHRTMTRVRMDANLRTVRVLIGQTVRLGAALRRRAAAGDVASIGFADVRTISQTLTATGPGIGAVVACLVVAALLFAVSGLLAVVVLAGVPLLLLVLGPLLGRLHGTTASYRKTQGALTARFVDMAGGLRVLSGLGGKEVVAARYRHGSRALQEDGYRVGAVTSWIDALQLGLPALFLAAVTWLAARMVAQGAISVGELVAVYGYVAVLVMPVTFLVECASDISRGLVAAQQVVDFLNLEPDAPGPAAPAPAPAPPAPAVLRDPVSGVEVLPGTLTALVGARAADTADVIDRLGRFTPSTATWGDTRLDEIAIEQVRARILVADPEAHLFAGPLRDVVAVRADRDEPALAGAVHAALAEDIVTALPAGLDVTIDAQGLNLSGGQRQRVRLVRALLADPEVLLAGDPTSALDAHTESAVASRLRALRAGRTTVVSSTSPLLLTHADTVYYLVDGAVDAVGTHRGLLAAHSGYRQLVARGADEDEDE